MPCCHLTHIVTFRCHKMSESSSRADSFLPFHVLTELLKDVEKKGIPFEKINLLDICNANPSIYGHSGDPRRRAVQKKWAKIKKKNVSAYLCLLDKHFLAPGPYTFARLKEEKEPPAQHEEKKFTIEETDSTGDEEEKVTKENEIEETVLPICDSSGDESSLISEIDQQFRMRKMSLFNSPDPKKPPFVPVIASPVLSVVRKASNDTAFANASTVEAIQPPSEDIAYHLLDFYRQDGSMEFPRIIMVQPGKPERHGPFCISPIDKKRVGRYDYKAYHVSRTDLLL